MSQRLPRELDGRRAALVVAHPGHELRVHGWLELARPSVWVLTDGSGHGELGRLGSTEALLARAGAAPGAIFGRLTDRAAYDLIFGRDTRAVVELAAELAAALVEEDVDYVAGDALEGFNPVHDLCRVLIDAAVAIARSRGHGRLGHPLSFDFPLEAPPDERPPGRTGDGVLLELDVAALARKLAAARAYPELAAEVEATLARHGPQAFRRERLRPVPREGPLAEQVKEKPFYETHGERQVAAGHYRTVLRFREHFLPLAEEIAAWTARACGS
ncbi:MAG TPA: hypothetical protein VNJ70_13250 [Thermoanaerobaculia bacterium]|nr:hypothetical protein [Thermoanaerobaculia bacterium]